MNVPIPPIPSPTTLQPGAQAQAIIAPAPDNKYAAYRQIGLIKGVDFVFLGFIMAHFLTFTFAAIFGKLTLLSAIGIGVQATFLAIIWLILLVVRVGVFVVELRANVELLPFDAARIAVGFLQGGTPLNTPVEK